MVSTPGVRVRRVTAMRQVAKVWGSMVTPIAH
jgi:hypothetical protein